MNLESFKEDIYKCSGCGQCQSVCPIYKILKSECAVSRGKFNLLNAIVNRDISFSKKTEKIMDLCLNCGACKEFCPANIDAQQIINAAKTDLFNMNLCSFSKKIAPFFSVHPLFLNILKILIDFYRKYKIMDFIETVNFKFFHNKKIILLNNFLKIRVEQSDTPKITNPVLKIAYFKGCVNNYINPSTFNAAKKILTGLKVEIVEPKFFCCGQSLKNIGNISLYKKIACKNIDLIPDDVDYIVTDCATCLTVLKSYAEKLNGSYRKKAEGLNDKFISIYELLEKLNYSFSMDTHCNIAYHNPCSNRFNNQEKTILGILERIQNTTVLTNSKKSECCGASFPFAFINNELSLKISENNSRNIINSGADIALTACPLCHIGLKQGFLENNSQMEVLQVIEYLALNS